MKLHFRIILILTCLISCLYHDIYAQTTKSHNNIIVYDGDTIKIDNRKIRLFGVDAPEVKQKCYDINGIPWNCGVIAKKTLEKLISSNKLDCIIKSIDLYKREVCICYVGDDDINQIMVQKGMAVAYSKYSKKYLSDEKLARKQFAGIWSSSFMTPEDFRKYSKLKNNNIKLLN